MKYMGDDYFHQNRTLFRLLEHVSGYSGGYSFYEGGSIRFESGREKVCYHPNVMAWDVVRG